MQFSKHNFYFDFLVVIYQLLLVVGKERVFMAAAEELDMKVFTVKEGEFYHSNSFIRSMWTKRDGKPCFALIGLRSSRQG